MTRPSHTDLAQSHWPGPVTLTRPSHNDPTQSHWPIPVPWPGPVTMPRTSHTAPAQSPDPAPAHWPGPVTLTRPSHTDPAQSHWPSPVTLTRPSTLTWPSESRDNVLSWQVIMWLLSVFNAAQVSTTNHRHVKCCLRNLATHATQLLLCQATKDTETWWYYCTRMHFVRITSGQNNLT